MRILFWHGYLLSGSGSNIFTSSLARTWRGLGHDVLLLCQDPNPSRLAFIDSAGSFDDQNRSFELTETNHPPAPGRCRMLRPDIGKILPIYVGESLPRLAVKRFVDLTDEELNEYVERNRKALVAAIRDHRPEAIFVNHEVMGPFIARGACEATSTDYVALLHGSALEYAVRVQERYLDFAREGLMGAKTVVGGSEYMVEAASGLVPGWEDQAVVVNPGCDVELFRPNRSGAEGPTVGFVGALIPAKGIHLLLAAVPMADPAPARVVIVGGGPVREPLEELWTALQSGDLEGARRVASVIETPPFRQLQDFLSSPLQDGYVRTAGEIEVSFAGKLEHPELAGVLPEFDVLVVPSLVAEAFGLVAAEAAACGVLPVVPDHSGIAEIASALENAADKPGLLTYDPHAAIRGIASKVGGVLSLSDEDRETTETRSVELARERWSWETVAARLLEVAS